MKCATLTWSKPILRVNNGAMPKSALIAKPLAKQAMTARGEVRYRVTSDIRSAIISQGVCALLNVTGNQGRGHQQRHHAEEGKPRSGHSR